MFKHSFALVSVLGLSFGLFCTHSASALDFDKKLLAPDGASNDFFGNSVSLSGNTALVGNPRDDDNGVNSGSAYVFDITTRELLHKLTAPDGLGGDQFGYSVSIDGNTALIGSIWDDDTGIDSGSAYLFDVTTGELLHKLNGGAFRDIFGQSVSLSGNTALVGSSGGDGKATNSGTAYLFDVTTGELLQWLIAPDGEFNEAFGWSVSLSGNIALIGSINDNDKAHRSGSAYLFDVATGNFLQKLIAPDGAFEDLFGWSVSLSGNTALIGSPYDDDNGNNSGSAYLFDVTTGELLHKLTAPDGAFDDFFGNSVSLSGNTALIGSPYDDDNGNNSGSAYLFDVTTGNFLEKLITPDVWYQDRFGNSVSLSDNTALVGSYLDDDNGTDSGSAYVFTGGVTEPQTPDPEKIPEPSLILGLLAVGSMGALVGKRK